MFDPDCLDLDPKRDPHANDDLSVRDWSLLAGLVAASYALAFGIGYWIGGW